MQKKIDDHQACKTSSDAILSCWVISSIWLSRPGIESVSFMREAASSNIILGWLIINWIRLGISSASFTEEADDIPNLIQF